jgi:hypothetical protein
VIGKTDDGHIKHYREHTDIPNLHHGDTEAQRRAGDRVIARDLVIGKFKIGNRQPVRWQVPVEPFNMSCGEKLQRVEDQLLDTRWSNEEDDQCDREWRDAPERD